MAEQQAATSNADANKGPSFTETVAKIWSWITGKETRLAELETQVANLATIQNQLTQAQTDLKAAKDASAALQTKVDELTKANEELTKKAEVSQKEVERLANLKAGERLAQVNIAPVKEEAAAAEAQPDSLMAQFNAEADPAKRGELFAKLRASKKWSRN